MEAILKNENCSARIISKGAELKSLVVNGRELMWRADPAFWGKTSPLLFPMIGTLKDGKTLINGKEYAIEFEPNAPFVEAFLAEIEKSKPDDKQGAQ